MRQQRRHDTATGRCEPMTRRGRITAWTIGALALIGLIAWGQTFPDPCDGLTGDRLTTCQDLEYP